MTPTVEKRFEKIINAVYIALIIGLSYLFIKYCLGMVFPFIIAFFVAMIVQRPTNALYKKTKKFKGIISTVFVLLIFLMILCVVSLLGAKIVSGGKSFVGFITDKINDFPTFVENIESWLLRVITVLPDSMEAKLTVSIQNGLERFKELTAGEAAGQIFESASKSEKFSLSSIVSPIGGGVWSVVKEIPSALIATVTAVVASCFMASDYDRLVGFLKNQLNRKHRDALSKSKRILLTTLKNLFKAYGTIMVITFAELALGLFILQAMGIYNSGYIIEISIITAIVDIVPVLGTGTIMVPWALYSLITGKISLGIGLIVVYVIILILRQVLEPKLVATKLGLPPVLTIAAMYIGTQLFGFIGLFLMPIITIMIKRLNDEGVLHIWKSGKAAEPPQAPEAADAEEQK